MRQLGVDTLALGVASATILLASVLALYQDNLKARLAFSTISQLSYIVLGGALLTTSGIVGGIAHITNHAVSKITLFFCAGSIYASAHKTDVSQMSGLARKMPWTMAAFAIASLSLVGIPPSSGFISKWYLALGSVERGSQWVLAVLLVSSLLNAAYLGPVVYKAYFEVPAAGHDRRSHSRGAVDGGPDGLQRRAQPAPGNVSRSGSEAGGNGESREAQTRVLRVVGGARSCRGGCPAVPLSTSTLTSLSKTGPRSAPSTASSPVSRSSSCRSFWGNSG